MAQAERRAEVVWEGNLTDGKGSARMGTGAFGDFPVSWPARTERPDGMTSPEELLAAAHAACYAMSLSHTLNGAGNPPERLDVSAAVTLEIGTGVTTSKLVVRGRVPGMDAAEFERLAREGERTCPISNAIRNNVDIQLDASLAE